MGPPDPGRHALWTPQKHLNKSAETGIIPEDWKSANVNTIRKKGNRQKPEIYRPISLTSVVCKTMERLVIGKIIMHLEGNNLIGTLNMASETSAAA